MTRREAEAIIYREMAESLRADISDKPGGWLYQRYQGQDQQRVVRAAERIATNYEELHTDFLAALEAKEQGHGQG